MSVLDTLLISAYSFLDSTEPRKETNNGQNSLSKSHEFHVLDDGFDEIDSSSQENNKIYKYFTSTQARQNIRKSKRSAGISDVSEGSNIRTWMKDEDITVIE